MSGRDLRPLFEPASVAVVGASADPLKWGYGLARGALRGRGRRPVYLVNRHGRRVLGERTFRSLDELPGPAELVLVAVAADAFEQTVQAALAAGARAIVGVTAGLGELDAGGRERERAVADRVRAGGAVLLGPNCLGVFDAAAGPWRGRPALAVEAAARVLSALSRLAAAHPEIAELEVNPLLVTVDGALGLDARLVLRREGGLDAR